MYVMAFKFLTIVSRHKMNEYAINIPKLNKLNNKQKKNKVFHMHLTSLKFFVLIPLKSKPKMLLECAELRGSSC